MELIEKQGEFTTRFDRWNANDDLTGYPWIENIHAPFTPVRRALPMLNLALITSAGAYIDGTAAFDTESKDGDLSFREIPVEVEAGDLRYAAKGYDPAAVTTSSVGVLGAVPSTSRSGADASTPLRICASRSLRS